MGDQRFFENHGAILNNQFLDSWICMIGIGHALSFVGSNLAKLGAKNFITIDPDTVEAKNIFSSIYNKNNLNCDKVKSYNNLLGNIIADDWYNSTGIDERTQTVGWKHKVKDLMLPPADFYIIGVDSGSARLDIFNILCNIKSAYTNIPNFDPYVIDIRFKFESFIGYAFKLNDKNNRFMASNYNEIKDVTDIYPCNARSHPLAVSLAGVIIPRIVLELTRRNVENIIFFGGNGEDLFYNSNGFPELSPE